jgi:hypothetical protein
VKYLCLVYQEEQKLRALSDADLNALVGDCMAWVGDLEKTHRHVLSAGLQSVRSASTVRIREGKVSVTDGPFAETKEFLGGFTLFEARDLNEAIRLASKLPAARVGTVEVRPILEADVPSADALDRRIGAAIRRNAVDGEPAVTTRMVSVGVVAPER